MDLNTQELLNFIEIEKNKSFNCEKLLIDLANFLSPMILSLKSFESLSERTVLFEDETMEVVLCNWKIFTAREWHYHENKQCWFKCIHGTIQENREDSKNKIIEGMMGYIDDSYGPHQIENITAYPAITLHLYKNMRN